MTRRILTALALGLAVILCPQLHAQDVFIFNTNNPSWTWRKGTSEASNPVGAWRATNYNEAGFTAVPAPFYYGDLLTGGTLITDMLNSYSSIFLRKTFVVTNASDYTALKLGYRCDDGFIAWLNGVEVFRYNMPAGNIPFNGTAPGAVAIDPAPFFTANLSAASFAALVGGTNVLAIQAFNAGLGSSDLIMDVSLTGTLDQSAPVVLFQLPFAGSTLTSLSQIEVNFSKNVTGVDASDLLIRGVAATNVTALSGSVYLFRFPPQTPGAVNVQFAGGHGIQDQATTPHPFTGASWSYTVDPNYVAPQEVRINELVAANVTGLRDEDNEAQDWVELKNTGSNAVSLAGWSLTDDSGDDAKWVFPSIVIPSGGFVVIFCSEKDRKPTTPGSRLHTNFKLDPDGEFLGLYNAESPRQLVSSFNPYPNQRRDYSYGLDPGNQLRYFATPTPGSNNPASTITGIVADTKFSHDRGFYSNTFSLSITCATPGVTIRYTLNGVAPTESSGTIYSGPITISGTTVIRALAGKAGMLPSDVDAQTYLFVNDIVTQSANGAAPAGWPATWGGNVVDYGMDPDIVNGAPWNATVREDLKAIPSLSIVMNLDDLFGGSGIYSNPGNDGPLWERPGSLELIYPDDTPGFQINCGFRLRGGFSRSTDNPKHAFRLFFRQEYGASKLNYPMFGPTGAKEFDKFDLRTMQNYSWAFQGDSRMMCLRDVMSRDAQLAMNGISTRGNFYHLYINGVYWGLYNSEERPEAAFAESYLGGNADDYDVIKQVDGYLSDVTDGNTAAWYRLWQAATNGFASDLDYFKIQGLNVDGTINTNYENLVDVPNMIDYMLVILYGGNLDAPISAFLGNDSPNNWYGFRDRTGKHGGFRFVSHDAEHTLLNVNEDRTGITDLSASGGAYGAIMPDWTCGNPLTQAQGVTGARDRSTPQYIWFRMHQNPEFRMLAADRIQKHCFVDGPLSVAGMRTALLTRSNEIQRAIIAESARWGDAKRGTPYNRNDWLNAFNTVLNSFVPGRTAVLINQLRADGLFPNLNAPLFSSRGGAVSNGFSLFMTNNNGQGTIFYTLDGSDPRVRGGGNAPSAIGYTAGTPLVMNFPTVVRARVKSGSVWSAITEATFYPVQDFSGLRMTEIMYNPFAFSFYSGDDMEFIELKNTGATTLDFGGARFSAGVDFTFTNGTRVAPGQFLVLGRNRTALTNRYPGLAVAGVYAGGLNNGGETLTITGPLGTKLIEVDFKDGGRWPVTPDGFGFSLVPKDPNVNPSPSNPSNWRASTNPGGSPGADDPASTVPRILVNESLTHPLPPNPDAIELHNPTASDADLGGWFLTDDSKNPIKFRIPNGTMIPAGGYLVFTETNFNATPGVGTSFSLSSFGEEVYLLAGNPAGTNLTGYSHGFSFGAAALGVSFGRHVISTGDERFVAQISTTLDATNSGPRVGPVVVRQIMYHPQDYADGSDNSVDEYIELKNSSGAPVLLYDTVVPTNTWRLRGGVDFDFPTNLTLGTGQSLLLVNFDVTDALKLSAFRSKYATYASLAAYGPYSDKLDNSSDTVELRRPGTPDTNGVPYIVVDSLDYKDSAPWPSSPDGSGSALQRINLAAYADDPANWVGAAPLTILSLTPSSAAVRAGTNVTFAVTAIGTGNLTYQWRRDGINLAGATSDSLTVTNIQSANEGGYTVQVTDLSGSVISASVPLNVLVTPVFVVAPLSQTVVAGRPVTLSATVFGHPPPFTFIWTTSSVPVITNIQNGFTSFFSFIAPSNLPSLSVRCVVINLATPANGVSHQPAAIISVLADTDRDGLPDAWEISNAAQGYSPTNALDAASDFDGDGVSNGNEFICGTDPADPLSYLKVDQITPVGPATLTFLAVSNRTYTVQFKDAVNAPAWSRLADAIARNTNRVESVIDPNPGASRLYRLATPRVP